MDDTTKKYHSALSQCAELLPNMQDGDSIFDTAKFLAAHIAGSSQATKAQAEPHAIFNIIPTLTPEKEAAAERGFCPACSGADLKLVNNADGMRFFQCPKCKDITVLREVASVAKEATRDQDEQQANVFAAPASRHEAIAGAVARGWCTPENASKVMDSDLALAIVAEVEAEIARRGRAQGGNTNDKGSDIATTTSTVSAPEGWVSVDERLPEKTCLASYQPHFQGHNARIIRAVYFKQYQVEASGDDGQDTEYNEADDTDYIKAGWYERIDNWGDFSSVAVCEGTVTHWMPLPKVPVSSTGSEA